MHISPIKYLDNLTIDKLACLFIIGLLFILTNQQYLRITRIENGSLTSSSDKWKKLPSSASCREFPSLLVDCNTGNEISLSPLEQAMCSKKGTYSLSILATRQEGSGKYHLNLFYFLPGFSRSRHRSIFHTITSGTVCIDR